MNSLLPHRLIDEYRLILYLVLLGTGQRFFQDGNDRRDLALRRAETTSTGIVMLVCEPAP